MRHWLKTCRDRGIAMVIGTTGLKEKDSAAIDVASADIPILQAANMSLGVNLLLKVVADVAKRLGEDYDIEIIEGHHRFKDAPSGTAFGIRADSILKSLGKSPQSISPRPPGATTPYASPSKSASSPLASAMKSDGIRSSSRPLASYLIWGTRPRIATRSCLSRFVPPNGSRGKSRGGIRWRMSWGFSRSRRILNKLDMFKSSSESRCSEAQWYGANRID